MSLFDDSPRPRRRRGAPRGAPVRRGSAPERERSDGAAPPGDATVSVAELTDRIDRALKGFGRVAVMGEVSRPKKVASGHLFFTLKDDRAALDVKIWRSGVERALAGVGGRLEEGARVVCHGSLDVYAPYGKHSLVADRVEARGIGALLADLERLKTQLRSEGLFDRKRPLPARPRTVGVVTSRDADAWRDFMRTRTLRWPGYPVRLAHSRVQGRAAAAEIARAIRALDASGVDVVVVCRGGGAIEDLWCFNEEPVARAVFDCSVPVVTGVGHESDTTLVDFVADHRAHTPTDAAQTVIPERAQLAERLERAGAYLTESMERALERRAEALERLGRSRALVRPTELVDERELRLDGLARRAAAALDARGAALGTRLERASGDLSRLSPHARLSALDERLGALGGRLASSVARDLERTDERVGRVTRGLARGAREAREAAERRVDVLERALGAVSPLAVLDRGYSITRRADGGEVVDDPAALGAGDRLTTIVRGGSFDSVVEAVRPPEASADPSDGEAAAVEDGA